MFDIEKIGIDPNKFDSEGNVDEVSKDIDFNTEIQKVLDYLNHANVCMMDFPAEIRKKAFKLEQKITKTANEGNKEEFLVFLEQWRNCFH